MDSQNLHCYLLLEDDQKKELNKRFSNAFGAILKDACIRRGVTYRQLSCLSGIDPANITKIIKGKHSPSLRIYSRLLYCLGFSVGFHE